MSHPPAPAPGALGLPELKGKLRGLKDLRAEHERATGAIRRAPLFSRLMTYVADPPPASASPSRLNFEAPGTGFCNTINFPDCHAHKVI